MDRAYNDYTYVPPSKLQQTSSPRVYVNGLLNAALVRGGRVTWWLRAEPTVSNAKRLEARLIDTCPLERRATEGMTGRHDAVWQGSSRDPETRGGAILTLWLTTLHGIGPSTTR
jgi:hypothetical protein